MNADNKYVRFDWAVKRMLRDKANFGVLEGLLTVLLNEPVHIMELLENPEFKEGIQEKVEILMRFVIYLKKQKEAFI